MLILGISNIDGILTKNFLRNSLNFEININDTVVTVNIIKKRRIKNTYLRIKNAYLIEISTNYYFTLNDAKNLIENKFKWLEKNIIKLKMNSLNDNEFYFLGVKYKNLDDRNIDSFYKEESLKIIPTLVEKYSTIMSLYPSSIKYRKNKRTWGSCNYKNGLNFNILLMKFPLELIEYVVIHELAHIKFKNHSKQFWELVEKYCSDYKQREKRFKDFL